jgi:hypothetical protein
MSDPITQARRFVVVRNVDHTGVSGTGYVADGVEWADGHVTLRWFGEHSSTVGWSSLDHAIAVHGHDGATQFVFVDDENGEPVDPVERRTAAMNAAHGVLWAGGDNPTTLQASEVVALAEWLMYGQASYEMPRRAMTGIADAKAAVRKHIDPPF